MNLNDYSQSQPRTLVSKVPICSNNDIWKFVDSKGSASLDETVENTCEQDDMISSLSFSSDGKYLGVGDYGGRVIIFKNREGKKSTTDTQYKSLLGLTSHAAEFDKLRSVVVAPTVEHMLWLNYSCNSHIFITANSSTIKLWKLKEGYRRKKSKRPLRMSTIKTIDDLRFPDFKRKHDHSPNLLSQYPSLYGSPINGISVSYDDQYFLVSDSTGIGMFNVERCEPRYELFRLEETNDENNELISTMTFLPYNSSIFCYGTSHGNVNVCDLRLKSHCEQSIDSYRNFFASKNLYHSSYNEIHCIRVLNDAQMLTRDFMSLCHWDLRMTQRPIEILDVNSHIRYKLWDLIESDSIFHRFQIAASPCARYFVTGAYNNQFSLFEKEQSNIYSDESKWKYPENSSDTSIDNSSNNYTKSNHQIFNRVVNSYLYNEYPAKNTTDSLQSYSSKNLLPMNPELFHDLDSRCPKRKLGSGCITEKSFDLLDRLVKTYDFARTTKQYNFEAGTNLDQQRSLFFAGKKSGSTSSIDNWGSNTTDGAVLGDISKRKLNKTSSTSKSQQNEPFANNDKATANRCFYPISFDPKKMSDRAFGTKPSIRNKISQVTWHPKKNMFVVATQFNLYFYEHSPSNNNNNNDDRFYSFSTS